MYLVIIVNCYSKCILVEAKVSNKRFIFGLITNSLYEQPVRAEFEIFISVYILFCD